MKDRKKQRGMKTEIRAYKKRLQYIAIVVTVAILVSLIAFTSFLIYSYLNPSSNQSISSTQPKAAIVDHLSLTEPNQSFIQKATTILENAGYTVDYYPGEKVNVEFYRNLPTHGYGLIILRVHSALTRDMKPPLALFTSEPYSRAHGPEQLAEQLGIALFHPYNEGDPLYFSVYPAFVKNSMKGRFQNTTIIMMGCNGLTYTNMAQALIEKGAKVYIGWDGLISASHTDQATTRLLEHLITENQTIKQAVTDTMNEVESDPAYGSKLDYYPKTL